MQLSKDTLKNITSHPVLVIPDEKVFSLPEKVLQFGTGVLLRGLPDYFIDKANDMGIFNGRVVVVKSTGSGATDEFSKQDNLYTLCVKGIEDGKKIEQFLISASISRVLSAKQQWNEILDCAHNPELKIIISNTTEVGITLVEDDIRSSPPVSFPGKLLAFLLERYKAFNGSEDGGMVIIPTELIPDNGRQLSAIVLELAKRNKLSSEFVNWLQAANHFCSSLVDRIVPGKLPKNDQSDTERLLGYQDDLMIMTEPFRLWAIESADQKVKQVLSFSQADNGVVIAPNIEKFRELKLRLLNGTHTFSCGLAFLAGFKTVKQAMTDSDMSGFIEDLACKEITPAMTNAQISYDEAFAFAGKVMDRFKNPFLDHQWLSITVQYSSKMKMRNIPLLISHYQNHSEVPVHMALGFAAFLLFMRCVKEDGTHVGQLNNSSYIVQDDSAAYFAAKWEEQNFDRVVDGILADKEFWETDLTSLNGFAGAVKTNLRSLMENGAMMAIRRVMANKTTVGS